MKSLASFLVAIAEAKTKIEARAAERFAREQADYEAQLNARKAKGGGQWQEAARQEISSHL